MSKEALKLALDDLMAEYCMERTSFAKRVDEIFKQALEQPVQPVAWEVSATKFAIERQLFLHKPKNLASYIRVRPLIYGDTTPPTAQRQWVGLTDRKVGKVIDDVHTSSQYGHHHTGFWMDFYRAIEAELKEKNT